MPQGIFLLPDFFQCIVAGWLGRPLKSVPFVAKWMNIMPTRSNCTACWKRYYEIQMLESFLYLLASAAMEYLCSLVGSFNPANSPKRCVCLIHCTSWHIKAYYGMCNVAQTKNFYKGCYTTHAPISHHSAVEALTSAHFVWVVVYAYVLQPSLFWALVDPWRTASVHNTFRDLTRTANSWTWSRRSLFNFLKFSCIVLYIFSTGMGRWCYRQSLYTLALLLPLPPDP